MATCNDARGSKVHADADVPVVMKKAGHFNWLLLSNSVSGHMAGGELVHVKQLAITCLRSNRAL